MNQEQHAEIGVIGGSGFYTFLDDPVEVDVPTPYGPPSDPVSVGVVSGSDGQVPRRVAFLPRHGRTRPTAEVAVWLFGTALLIATPTYPWYVVPLLALAVLARRYEWFLLGVAAYGAYAFYDHLHLPSLFFTAAAMLIGGCGLWRAMSSQRRADR